MKTQSKAWFFLFAIFTIITIIFCSCGKEDEISTEIKKEKVTGFVQKGPYINGTQILMSELNASLDQTGNLFTTQITNNRGSFEINDIALTSSFVEFSASGYFFDEVRGEITAAPLSLFALADITDISTVNVNILTHLERRRVEYLVKQNTSFAQAKITAQAEVLAIFGIVKENMQGSENLDIAVNNEDNAILLAISLILKGNRSVGDLTELLATISTDIREDGILNNQAIIVSLRNSTLELDLGSIRENLVARYNNLGVSASIPDFETYIEAFLNFSGSEPVTNTLPATDVTVSSAALNGIVHPNSLNTVVTFEFGQTVDLGNIIVAEQSPLSGHTNQAVSAVIIELEPGTTYYYRVKAENDLGITIGDLIEFTTMGLAPDAVSMPAENVNTNNARLKGIVNPGSLSTTVIFEYGTIGKSGRTMASAVRRTPVGSFPKEFNMFIEAEQSPLNGETDQIVTADLSGLEPGVAYHFRVKAENLLGVTFGDEMTFTTAGQVPLATTLDATDIGLNGATFRASVNPNHLESTIIFEYGTTTDYGNTIEASPNPVNGSSPVNVSAVLSQLNPGTTYHYRVRAENQLGVTYGLNKTFTTAGLAPIATTLDATEITTNGAKLLASVNPNHLESTIIFEYGTTTDYGNTIEASPNLVNGSSPVNVSAVLSQLNPGTTYHFRVKAENQLGVTFGNNMSFSTSDGIVTINTKPIRNIYYNSAESGGEILSDGGAHVTSRGIVWNTIEEPTIESNSGITSDGQGVGSFLSNLSNLEPGTTYFVRAYAQNSTGVYFGNQVFFTTWMEDGIIGSITDVDGNNYSTITFYGREWMTENLKVTKYNNGSQIPTGLSGFEWVNTTNGAYTIVPYDIVNGINSEEEMINAYGLLYNWHSVNDTRGLCPTGWRVLTEDDWMLLILHASHNANKLKSCRQVNSPIGGDCATEEHPRWDYHAGFAGTDDFGLAILPGGAKFDGYFGEQGSIGYSGYFWSADDSYVENENTAVRVVFRFDYSTIWVQNYSKNHGYSVRCIRNIE